MLKGTVGLPSFSIEKVIVNCRAISSPQEISLPLFETFNSFEIIIHHTPVKMIGFFSIQ